MHGNEKGFVVKVGDSRCLGNSGRSQSHHVCLSCFGGMCWRASAGQFALLICQQPRAETAWSYVATRKVHFVVPDCAKACLVSAYVCSMTWQEAIYYLGQDRIVGLGH